VTRPPTNVRISIRQAGSAAAFVPDPNQVVQTDDFIFFSNLLPRDVAVLFDGNALVTVQARDESSAFQVAQSGNHVVSSSDTTIRAATIGVADQLVRILPGQPISFDPVTITAGQFLRWENDTDVPQTLVSATPGAPFPTSPVPSMNWSGIAQFPTAGTFNYHALSDSAAQGVVTVTAAAVGGANG